MWRFFCCHVEKKGTPSFCIALLRYVIVIIPAAFRFGKILGANGVWLAFPVSELLTAVVMVIAIIQSRKV